MNNLRDYIKIYPEWIDNDLREKTLDNLSNAEWSKHTFNVYGQDKLVSLSGDKELEVTYCDNKDNSAIMKRLWDGYYRYLSELRAPWFSSWNGFTQVRYNRYSPGQTMAKHCDHISSIFEGDKKGVPILSAVGLLNDNFTGGEFMMWNEKIELKAGDLMVFPANFMYPHMVKPVIFGVRYSFVAWAW